jgi:hypothetical protein
MNARVKMMRTGLLFGMVLCCGCSGTEAEAPDTGPAVATVRLMAPPPKVVAPGCVSPVVRLYVDGEMLSCPVATFEPNDGKAPTTLISCNESKGLLAGVEYRLEVMYLQGTTIIARGLVSPKPITLQVGLNSLEVPPANVTTSIDTNSNGTSDMREACP